MVDERIVATLVVIIVVAVFRLAFGGLVQRKLRQLVGHQLLSNTITAILSVSMIIYLIYVWGIVQAIGEMLVAFSAITAVVLFAAKDIRISNLLAGISLIGDKLVKIGTEVEVGGRRGTIFEMTLTLTKLRTPSGGLIIVPNKKFREEVIVIAASPESE